MKEKFIKFWFITNGVLLVLLGVGIYFLFQQFNASESDYMDKLNKTSSLTSSAVFPDARSTSTRENQLKELKKLHGQIRNDFGRYQHEINVPSNFTAFFSESVQSTKDYLDEKSVAYEEGTFFGFEDYATQAVKKQFQADICYSLDAALWFIKMASDEGITELVNIHRTKHELTPVNPRLERDRPLKSYDFEIIIKGSEDAIRETLNRLTEDKKYYVGLSALKIESSMQSPLVVKQLASSSKTTLASVASILGNETAEDEEDDVEIIKVSGESDLYAALQLKFIRLK